MDNQKKSVSPLEVTKKIVSKEYASPSFPQTRLRRNRTDGWLRDMVAENSLSVKDLIWPVFVIEGKNKTEDVKTMPNVRRYSIDLLCAEAKKAEDMGIPAIAIFPALDGAIKTENGAEAYNPDNLVNRSIRAIKDAAPGIGVIADVALDPYTSHGHDGLVHGEQILNDETIDILCKQALMQARAGVDIIAPSDMMDGRIGSIRATLDQNGYENVKIMSYAAKYASAFYGPFRDAVNSGAFLKGDKKTYQMNPANSDEAIREVELDINEGADMVMIKPGMPYLDIIYRIKNQFHIPTFAYNVSGEYAMLKMAAEAGCIDYNKAAMEMLLGFKRAGADGILSYAAIDAAEILSAI